MHSHTHTPSPLATSGLTYSSCGMLSVRGLWEQPHPLSGLSPELQQPSDFTAFRADTWLQMPQGFSMRVCLQHPLLKLGGGGVGHHFPPEQGQRTKQVNLADP